MPNENNENLELKNYLLGSSEAGKQEQIEERLMTDDDFFQQFLATEEDLIQDYADGDLTDNEKTQFETHFLISEERQKKVEFARTLRRNINAQSVPKMVEEVSEKKTETKLSLNFFQRLFASPLANPVPAFLVLITFIGVIGIAVLYYSSGSRMTPLESEFAKLNKEDFSDLEKHANNLSLSLISGTTRNSYNIKNLAKENLTDKIFFRLALPNQSDSGEVFKIELIKFREIIFTQNQIHPYKNQDGEELRFLIPSSVLEPGKYQIRAKSDEASEFSYSFSVE